jgi:hypothetical protein
MANKICVRIWPSVERPDRLDKSDTMLLGTVKTLEPAIYYSIRGRHLRQHFECGSR